MALTRPRGLRCETSEDGRTVVVRPRTSKAIMLTAFAVWNAAFAVTLHARSPWWFTAIGSVAALAFGYFAMRAFRGAAIARFERDRFTVHFGPWPLESFEHPVADIQGFAVDRDEDGSHRVVLVTRGSSARLPVPLPLDGLRITLRGSKETVYGLAPREWAEHVAVQLDDSLDRMRRNTTGLRIEAPMRLAEPEADDEEPEEVAVTRAHGQRADE